MDLAGQEQQQGSRALLCCCLFCCLAWPYHKPCASRFAGQGVLLPDIHSSFLLWPTIHFNMRWAHHLL
jgi:hypothetical protein